MITDHQRFEFMMMLAENVRGKNGLVLPDWENRFLASFLQSSRPSLWFTEGRRTATDRIWMRFGPEINHPHPTDRVSERPRMADADPSGCEYLVRLDGRQQRCNEPAEYQELGRLRYCRMHAEAVVKDMKRANKIISLIKL